MTAASGADQPTLRDQLAEWVHAALKRLEEGDLPHEVAVRTDDGVLYWDELDTSEYLGLVLLPLIEADRERAVAHALAARVLRDIDYAVEREGST